MAKKKSTSTASIMIGGMNKSQERKWEVENAISTLKRAEEIRKDAGLMRDVKKSVIDLQKSIIGSPMKTKSNNNKK